MIRCLVRAPLIAAAVAALSGCYTSHDLNDVVEASEYVTVTVVKLKEKPKSFIFDMTLANAGDLTVTGDPEDLTCGRGKVKGEPRLSGGASGLRVRGHEKKHIRVTCKLEKEAYKGDYVVQFGAFGDAAPPLKLAEDLGGRKSERKDKKDKKDKKGEKKQAPMHRNVELSDAPPSNFARFYYDRDNLGLYLHGPNDSLIHYQTASVWVVGGSVSYRGLSIAASYSDPHTNQVATTSERTDIRAFDVDFDTEHTTWEAYSYSWSGFAVGNPYAAANPDGSTNKVDFRHDIKARAYGLSMIYIKSPNDFALPGRASSSDLPDGSGISLVAGAQVGTTEVAASRPMVSSDLVENYSGPATYQGEDVTALDVSAGFGASLVFGRLDLSGSMQLGAGPRLIHQRDKAGWTTGASYSVPSRLGFRVVDERGFFFSRYFEMGVYGVFDALRDGSKNAVALEWQRDIIETYLGIRF